MNSLVFVHGWGMGPELWSPIISRLPGVTPRLADLGFRGSPAKPVVSNPLVIAHSLGVMWAIRHLPLPWAGLVSISGFTRFTCSDHFPGVAPLLLEQMKSRLRGDMNGVLDRFLRLCGMTHPIIQGFDQDMLSQGLEWLLEWDTRAQFSRTDCPVLAICGASDPIVTEPHSRACFSSKAFVVVKEGGHLMPLTHVDWLVSRIAAIVQGDWSA
ncbi:MAG: alpha/beta hydrolase [Ferrovum sp.]|nr:alpha/beta hydrolase [Ferrovum sp.]